LRSVALFVNPSNEAVAQFVRHMPRSVTIGIRRKDGGVIGT